MSEKVMVRLFFASSYSSSCSCGGGCAGGPNKDMTALELFAGKLVKKFGEEQLGFEAYSAIDFKKFPYLIKAVDSTGNIALPIVSVDETVLAPGAIPLYSELEKEVGRLLKR
ncbi:MAG: hypothetical protein NT130_04685 [Candidatus Micrarchaeota archaeon]|nr:hypothetical protein [Candidatus Micrarchaeota archaeon]